jgi:ABC-2 type transport system permease protein
VGGQLANVKLNASYMVFQYYAGLGFLGLLMVTAFVNASAIRDFTNNTQQIMFSTPLKKGAVPAEPFPGQHVRGHACPCWASR